MVIRRSAAAEIRLLVEHLLGGDPVQRDAAAARLAIIGPRAVPALLDALARADAPLARAAIVRALETIHDPRALPPAIDLLDDPDTGVSTAAVAVLRGFLRASDAALADAAFERLAGLALDASRPEAARAAALEALGDLPAATVGEVLRQLESDPSAVMRRAAGHPAARTAPARTLADVAAGARCPGPGELRAMIAAEGHRAPLGALAHAIDLAREREVAEPPERRGDWQAARAEAHRALAARGSRIALYDLRETLALAPGPLPVAFLAALERVGDASCLEPVAAAYTRAAADQDSWWMEHLQRAFRTIVQREGLTRRSAAVKRALARWPGAASGLWPARRRSA